MYASRPGAIPMIHELTHAFGIFLGDAMPNIGPAGFYSHWGITMHSDAPASGDRIGQLGGYKRGAFKCKDGSIPSSAKGATNGGCSTDSAGLVELQTLPGGWGAPAQSYDGIPFANYELQLLGLRSKAENAAEPEAVYCEGAKGGATGMTCTKLHFISAQTIEDKLSSKFKEARLSKGDTIRAAVVVVFDGGDKTVATPTSVADLDKDEHLKWFNGYVLQSVACIIWFMKCYSCRLSVQPTLVHS